MNPEARPATTARTSPAPNSHGSGTCMRFAATNATASPSAPARKARLNHRTVKNFPRATDRRLIGCAKRKTRDSGRIARWYASTAPFPSIAKNARNRSVPGVISRVGGSPTVSAISPSRSASHTEPAKRMPNQIAPDLRRFTRAASARAASITSAA